MKWQSQKSAKTRVIILQAAIDCITELGYARTTTAKISQRTGLTRGAMLHHFPSRSDLLAAAVEFLHERRLETVKETLSQIPKNTPNRVQASILVYWEHLTSPLFIAFHELSVAARTDPELAKVFIPARNRFDEAWHQTARQLFPEWRNNSDQFDLALDLTQNLMEGMAINQMQLKDEARANRLLEHLENQLKSLSKDLAPQP